MKLKNIETFINESKTDLKNLVATLNHKAKTESIPVKFNSGVIKSTGAEIIKHQIDYKVVGGWHNYIVKNRDKFLKFRDECSSIIEKYYPDSAYITIHWHWVL